jgi:ubiquinone/menaquinone biosynthesis C-methylase UbiE
VRRPFGVEYAWRPSWRFWERLYIRFFGFVDLPGRLRARLMIPEILARHPQSILDFGCGTGCYSFYLSRNPGIHVCGVELDSTRIRESNSILERLKRENLTFSPEGQNAPLAHFPAHSFDLALAVEVLQYIPHIQESLRGIYRVLKPGGYLLGHVPMLGYLRPKEMTLFSDEMILLLLGEAGFGSIRVTPTFHGMTQKICYIYEKISHSKLFVALLFPWLLLASVGWKIQGGQGDYRFFTAQKPKETDERPEGLEERGQSPLKERPFGPRGALRLRPGNKTESGEQGARRKRKDVISYSLFAGSLIPDSRNLTPESFFSSTYNQ